MLILFVIATIISCIFSFVCYSVLYVFIFMGICACILFIAESWSVLVGIFGSIGAFFIVEELAILIPLLIWCIIDYISSGKDEVKK